MGTGMTSLSELLFKADKEGKMTSEDYNYFNQIEMDFQNGKILLEQVARLMTEKLEKKFKK